MQSAKDEVKKLLERLPDDVSYDEILYEIELNRRIDEGIAQAERGEVVSHEQAMEQLKRWLK